MEVKRMALTCGSYTPAQAQEMLTQLIKSEQQFHRLQNFITLIRFEGNCEQATENIQRLSRAQEKINRLVALAKAENLHLQVEASLKISLVEEPMPEAMDAIYPSL